jgi:hypothetical protein
MFAPASAKVVAIPSPMPRPAPVITAVFPARSNKAFIASLSQWLKSGGYGLESAASTNQKAVVVT